MGERGERGVRGEGGGVKGKRGREGGRQGGSMKKGHADYVRVKSIGDSERMGQKMSKVEARECNGYLSQNGREQDPIRVTRCTRLRV